MGASPELGPSSLGTGDRSIPWVSCGSCGSEVVLASNCIQGFNALEAQEGACDGCDEKSPCWLQSCWVGIARWGSNLGTRFCLRYRCNWFGWLTGFDLPWFTLTLWELWVEPGSGHLPYIALRKMFSGPEKIPF